MIKLLPLLSHAFHLLTLLKYLNIFYLFNSLVYLFKLFYLFNYLRHNYLHISLIQNILFVYFLNCLTHISFIAVLFNFRVYGIYVRYLFNLLY
jgi:hypothetical protein